jgi:hypothetical protein
MVQQLQWEPLQISRVKIRLVLLYKIQHGLVAIPAETYLVPGDTRTHHQFVDYSDTFLDAHAKNKKTKIIIIMNYTLSLKFFTYIQ